MAEAAARRLDAGLRTDDPEAALPAGSGKADDRLAASAHPSLQREKRDHPFTRRRKPRQ
jgi:hypothetical protein